MKKILAITLFVSIICKGNIIIDDDIFEIYCKNENAKINLPISFSKANDTIRRNSYGGFVLEKIIKTGIGQSISMDIRENKDSVIFAKNVGLNVYGYLELNNFIVFYARNEAGEASENYLFSFNKSGEIIDNIKVRKTLAWENKNGPLDFLQTRIDEDEKIITSEIIYPGNEYVNIFMYKGIFIGYRLDITYIVNDNGLFEQTDSVKFKPKIFDIANLFGKNLHEIGVDE